jgi:Tol biopolymer transport system component
MTGPKGLTEVQGGKEKVLIHFDDGSFLLDPAISTDGKRIAFAVQHPATADKNGKVDFGSDLFIANRDGSGMKELIHHSAPGEFISRPNWLQDNRQLLFDVRGTKPNNDADLRIESVDIDTGARQRLIENGVEPAIAPDGKTVAYVYIDPATQHEQIISADVTTGQSKPLTGPDATQVFNIELTWSPDGETLAFAAADPSVLAPGGASLGPTFVSLATGPSQVLGAPVAMLHPFLQDVWTVKNDGTGLKRIADIGESQPSLAWSTDGVYVYAMGATNFWRIKAADSSKEIIGTGQPSGQVRVLK